MPTQDQTLLFPHLLSSYPRRNRSEGKYEWMFKYLGPTGAIEPYVPNLGDQWEVAGGLINVFTVTSVIDGKVLDHDHGPNAATPDEVLMELEVTVTRSFEPAGAIPRAVLERDVPSLTWTEQDIPIEAHPDFHPPVIVEDGADYGGDYELTDASWAHVYGWKNEVNPVLRSQFKYVPRDVNGTPVGGTMTISGNALVVCQLLRRGFETYVDYYPVWTVTGTYRGYTAPPSGDIGLRVENPVGIGYPPGYQWVQNDDSNQNRGDGSSKWSRTRRFLGASRVYFDRKKVYPITPPPSP